MISNNHIVVDLNKCQYAYLYYVNQYGNKSRLKPLSNTVRGEKLTDELAMFHPSYPDETLFRRAERLGLMDVWTPVLHLKLTAYSHLVYTGDKAWSLWKAWNKKMFANKEKD